MNPVDDDTNPIDQVFEYAIKNGYAAPAQLLYPHVTNISVITIHNIVYVMKMYFSQTPMVDMCLKKYVEIFEFLLSINFRIDEADDITDLFVISAGDYLKFGQDLRYLKILECTYQMVDHDRFEPVINYCISKGNLYGFKLIQHIGILGDYNLTTRINNCYDKLNMWDFPLNLTELAEVFSEYGWLNSENLSIMFGKYIKLRVLVMNEPTFIANIQTLIHFAINNGYVLTLDDDHIAYIGDEKSLDVILNSGIRLNIRKQIRTSPRMCDILNSRGIDAIVGCYPHETEKSRLKN